MATEQTWAGYAATASSIMEATGIDGLADGANVLSGDLDSDGLPFMDLTLIIASQTATREPDAHVKIYVLASVDDAAYPKGSGSVDPVDSNEVYTMLFSTVGDDERATIRGIVQPPNKFRILLMQETGVLFNDSGNILERRQYNLRSS